MDDADAAATAELLVATLLLLLLFVVAVDDVAVDDVAGVADAEADDDVVVCGCVADSTLFGAPDMPMYGDDMGAADVPEPMHLLSVSDGRPDGV